MRESFMRGRVMKILATAVVASSLLATGAQARGGGGGGGGHIGRLGGVHIAHIGHEHFGAGRHRFVGGGYGGYDDYGLNCPYYGSPYYRPYTCDY